MNKIKLKKNDILKLFDQLTRYPVIHNVMENNGECKSQSSCLHCSTAFNECGSLSHIVFQQDNKKDTCSYCHRTNNNIVISHHGSKSNITNKLVNSAKQPWTRNKKMVQVAAAVLALLVLTFCLLFQPGASPQEENSPSWSSDIYNSARMKDNLLMTFPSSPSVASRFGLVRRKNEDVLAVEDIHQKDLFISVKTSQKFHRKRLDLVLKTWFQLARDQTWFFTDQHDEEFEERTNGHLKVTECSSSHSRQALCCKMAAEFDAFLDSGKK